MSRLNALRRMLATPTVTQGRVHSINGSSALISTSRGTATVKIAAGLKLSVDDKVKVRDGLIISKLRDTTSLPVYDV